MAFVWIQYARKRSKCNMSSFAFIGTIHGSFQHNRYNVLARVEHDTTLTKIICEKCH